MLHLDIWVLDNTLKIDFIFSLPYTCRNSANKRSDEQLMIH